MKDQILIKRYTQGLVNSIKDEEELSALSGELSDFAELLEKHKELNDTLCSQFLPTTKKIQVAEDILVKKSLGKKISRFILLLVENNRLELLLDIIKSLPDVWNEEKGIYTFDVVSVVPLTEAQRKDLKNKLELLERRPVVLKYRIDLELVGGLWIQRGNIVYDASIKGDLMKLKEKICER
ncbi:MAG: ATP synthase F1 subunit delta [Candidatus Aminicenantes bacterium]|nr:ATP synthase F1 subunit delta [Candidatus Aminicenantes bacterium]